MPIRTIHNQGQPLAIPHPTQKDAPQALAALIHQISDNITSHVTRQHPVRTIRMNDGIHIAIEHEQLNGVLYSFSTDFAEVVRYTPIQWNRISLLVIHIGQELQARSEHNGNTMFVFLHNEQTVILTKSTREHGGTVRRTTSWNVAVRDFLAEIQGRMTDLGREIYQSGFTTHNEPLKNAGRELVARGHMAMDMSRRLDSDHPQAVTPNFTELHPNIPLVV